jgi:hypothetical protein
MNFKLWIAIIIGWALMDHLLAMIGLPYIVRLLIIGVVLWNLEDILHRFGIWL